MPPTQIFQSHRLSIGRVSTAGNAYHIRFGTRQRQQYFSNLSNARAVALSLGNEHKTGRTQCLCFCVMPDHVHWLIVLRQGTLGQSVHNIKRLSKHLSGINIPVSYTHLTLPTTPYV